MNQIFKYVGSGVAAFATAGGLWMWGFGVGGGQADRLVSLLQEQKTLAVSDSERMAAENVSLKLELQRSIETCVSEVLQPGAPMSGVVTTEEDSSVTNAVLSSQEPSYLSVSVGSRQSQSLFEDKLILSLIGTTYTGSPLRYQALFTVGYPGMDSVTYEGADPGFRTEFAGYEIRVMSTASFSAIFRVQRLAGE